MKSETELARKHIAWFNGFPSELARLQIDGELVAVMEEHSFVVRPIRQKQLRTKRLQKKSLDIGYIVELIHYNFSFSFIIK